MQATKYGAVAHLVGLSLDKRDAGAKTKSLQPPHVH